MPFLCSLPFSLSIPPSFFSFPFLNSSPIISYSFSFCQYLSLYLSKIIISFSISLLCIFSLHFLLNYVVCVM
nr:MAG TPA: hypothetical protein [Caudoviricetes sp.]